MLVSVVFNKSGMSDGDARSKAGSSGRPSSNDDAPGTFCLPAIAEMAPGAFWSPAVAETASFTVSKTGRLPEFQAASSDSIFTKQPDMSTCQRTLSKTKNSGSGPK